jgi:hypothetical protein
LGLAFGEAARPLVTGASPLLDFDRRIQLGGWLRRLAAVEIQQPCEAPAGPSELDMRTSVRRKSLASP